MKTQQITPKAIEALRLLEGTTPQATVSASALARRLWPDRFGACGTSLRRGGLYRAAGGYYARLQKQGLVGHYIDDFVSGYYITPAGREALDRAASA
jgi:hypothetical protein